MSNPIKSTIKTELLPIIIILAAVISSFYFYSNFPDKVPIHWNVAGEVDRYGSRTIGAFLFPAIILGMYLMFLGIPYIDPKKERYTQFKRVYHVFKNLLIVFMTAMYFITSFNALGYDISVATWIPLMVGALFVFLGNYMSKLKPNWFMGIRTPWTLSSEEVWNKTHRLGGKVFIGGGVILMTMRSSFKSCRYSSMDSLGESSISQVMALRCFTWTTFASDFSRSSRSILLLIMAIMSCPKDFIS